MSGDFSMAEAARRLGISRQRLDQLMNPEKLRARMAVMNAVTAGRLPSAAQCRCSDCGRWADEYDHYLGYTHDHRLDVQPVCVRCHKAREKSRRAVALESFVVEMRQRMDESRMNWGHHREPRHGSPSAYEYHGCRCDLCVTNETKRNHRMAQARHSKNPPQHGTANAYTNYACRCDPCRAAGAVHNKLAAAKRKARIAA